MSEFFFQEFLSRFAPGSPSPCACGMEHRVGVRDILLGGGALEESGELLRRRHGAGIPLWVLSDENTEAAAAERWKSALGASRVVSRVLPSTPKPVPTLDLAEGLAREARSSAPALLVGVGSGVVSDLVKKVSTDIGVHSWCVATAPSVDAYTSATSAIRVRGYSTPLPVAVSEVVVCDIEVMSRAPRTMFLSGLGDLLAKYLAFLDWNLSRIVTGELYCEAVERFALESARKALSAAKELPTDPFSAARSLTDAIIVSGLAMQAMGHSRPAASAEHAIAHFWEMSSAAANEELRLHGILVGAASRAVLPGYRSFYGGLGGVDPDAGERLAALEREPAWESLIGPEMRPFLGKMREETKNAGFDRLVVSGHLSTFRREREAIIHLAIPLLRELEQAVMLLEGLSYPFSLDTLAIARPYRMLPVKHVRFLRNRYSTFSLAHELGLETRLAAEIEGNM